MLERDDVGNDALTPKLEAARFCCVHLVKGGQLGQGRNASSGLLPVAVGTTI
ncbi:hypothetical protein [Sphingopyxis soli]|uniref:hypothetical protein n=1 Tax=Sphingopyxis soli TaxID=592051 RepID=UPI001BFDC97B|nr:hypothetical protein [Sphingopyxis soli]